MAMQSAHPIGSGRVRRREGGWRRAHCAPLRAALLALLLAPLARNSHRLLPLLPLRRDLRARREDAAQRAAHTLSARALRDGASGERRAARAAPHLCRRSLAQRARALRVLVQEAEPRVLPLRDARSVPRGHVRSPRAVGVVTRLRAARERTRG